MNENNKSRVGILLNGIIKENPSLVLVLGTCPTLAITTSAFNGIGMGVATLFVLVFSNLFISLLKNIIPDKVRIPAYVIVIAGLVTIVQLLVKAYVPVLDSALGIFLPLITVNCIILARAEAFASKNTVLNSVLDGVGMGIGFTLALFTISSIREIFGAGTWFGLKLLEGINGIFHTDIKTVGILTSPAGGFFIFGVIMALMSYILSKRGRSLGNGCAGCPSRESCNHVEGADPVSDTAADTVAKEAQQ